MRNTTLKNLKSVRIRKREFTRSIHSVTRAFFKKSGLKVEDIRDGIVYFDDGFNLSYADVFKAKAYNIDVETIKSWILHCVEEKRHVDLVAFHHGVTAATMKALPIMEGVSDAVDSMISPRTIQTMVDCGVYRTFIMDNLFHIQGVFNYKIPCEEGMVLHNSKGYKIKVIHSDKTKGEKFGTVVATGRKGRGGFGFSSPQRENMPIAIAEDLPDRVGFGHTEKSIVRFNYDVGYLRIKLDGEVIRELTPNSGFVE